MSPFQAKKARDRLQRLRAYLSDICSHIDSIGKRAQPQDGETQERLRVSVIAIRAVIDDLEAICSHDLNEAPDAASQQPGTQRAEMS